MALKFGIQTYQILKNDDDVCILSLSSILLAVKQSNATSEGKSLHCDLSSLSGWWCFNVAQLKHYTAVQHT